MDERSAILIPLSFLMGMCATIKCLHWWYMCTREAPEPGTPPLPASPAPVGGAALFHAEGKAADDDEPGAQPGLEPEPEPEPEPELEPGAGASPYTSI